MTIRTVTSAALFGFAMMAAGPAMAEPHKDTQHFLTAPGIGVVEDIGNSRAADVRLFDTSEHPKPLWVYDAETGEHVAREDSADRTRETQVQGPGIDFGIDVL